MLCARLGIHSETQIIALSSPGQTAANLNSAIFRNAAAEGFVRKAASLFPGIGFGAAYKILQRVYKFGGQPVVMDIMTKRYGADFDERFGHKTGRTLMSATSGSLIGIGESKWLQLIMVCFFHCQKSRLTNYNYLSHQNY